MERSAASTASYIERLERIEHFIRLIEMATRSCEDLDRQNAYAAGLAQISDIISGLMRDLRKATRANADLIMPPHAENFDNLAQTE